MNPGKSEGMPHHQNFLEIFIVSVAIPIILIIMRVHSQYHYFLSFHLWLQKLIVVSRRWRKLWGEAGVFRGEALDSTE